MRFSVDNLAECPRYESLAIAIEQNDSRNVALEGLRDRRSTHGHGPTRGAVFRAPRFSPIAPDRGPRVAALCRTVDRVDRTRFYPFYPRNRGAWRKNKKGKEIYASWSQLR